MTRVGPQRHRKKKYIYFIGFFFLVRIVRNGDLRHVTCSCRFDSDSLRINGIKRVKGNTVIVS